MPAASRMMPLAATRAEAPAYSSLSARSPKRTVYSNSSVAVPLPALYAAGSAAPPPAASTLSSSTGSGGDVDGDMPATTTSSSKLTATVMLSPGPYAAFGGREDTDTTAGGAPSTTMPAPPSDPAAPGAGRVRSAGWPVPASVIVAFPDRAPAPA